MKDLLLCSRIQRGVPELEVPWLTGERRLRTNSSYQGKSAGCYEAAQLPRWMSDLEARWLGGSSEPFVTNC